MTYAHATSVLLRLALCALALGGCREERAEAPEATTYGDVAPLMTRACNSCHDEDPKGGFRTTTYLSLISCTEEGQIATEPRDDRAPLIAVLSQKDHQGLLNGSERDTLAAWVRAGAPAFVGTVHPAGIIDPRSDAWHGKLVRQNDWAAIRDPNDPIACGRCHDGAPARPSDVSLPAPKATTCTTCHEEAEGVLSCSTCHGQESRPYPPRDACFFGGKDDAHLAHVTGKHFRTEPFTCGTCHPTPQKDVFAGSHMNGKVEIQIVDDAAGKNAQYDEDTTTCAVGCHAQGGRQGDKPSWFGEGPVDCQSCHLSPPSEHYPGTCNTCHAEMGKTPTSLLPSGLHLNGQIDLGNGKKTCGACHGADETGVPRDAGHRIHASTTLMSPLSCDECHDTPTQPDYPKHMNGVADVRFAGRATVRDQAPTLDSNLRCSAVACHGANLAGHTLEPRWTDHPTDGPASCVGCHDAPPPLPHIQSTSCGSAFCHGSEVGLIRERLVITRSGRMRHGDGTLQASGD